MSIEEYTAKKDKIETFMREEMGAEIFAFAFTGQDMLIIGDSAVEQPLGTYGLYEMMMDRNQKNRRSLLQKTGATDV